jgi:hypothetical protein
VGSDAVPVEVVEDGLTPWERALNIVKNIIVILTCLAILYTLWRGYVAVAAIGDALQEWQKSLEAL